MCGMNGAPLLRPWSEPIIFVAYWPILAWLAGRILALLSAGDVRAVARVMVITMIGFFVQKIGQ